MEVPQQVSHRVMSFLNCPIGLFGFPALLAMIDVSNMHVGPMDWRTGKFFCLTMFDRVEVMLIHCNIYTMPSILLVESCFTPIFPVICPA